MKKAEHDKLYHEILGQDSSYYEILKREMSQTKSPYFNRLGDPITYAEWSLLQSDPRYFVIRLDEIEPYTIVTSWMGTRVEDCIYDMFISKSVEDGLDIVKGLIQGDEERAIRMHNKFVFYAEQKKLQNLIGM